MERLLFHIPQLYSAVRLIGIQHKHVGGDWSYPEHRHTYFEFLYCVSGSIRQTAGGAAYTLKTGDALIIKPHVLHRTDRVDDTVFFDFHFDVEVKEIHAIFQLISDPFLPSGMRSGAPNGVMRRVDRFIRDFGKHLEGEQPEPGGASQRTARRELRRAVDSLHMGARIVEFIGFLAGYLLDRQEDESWLSDHVQPAQLKVAQDAAYWLETHAAGGMQVQEIADRLGVHRSYLTACFRAVYGTSPREYALRLRIREAKSLLRETDLAMEEIAGRLRFSSAGHFSRTFRDREGVSPLQFRRNSRAEE